MQFSIKKKKKSQLQKRVAIPHPPWFGCWSRQRVPLADRCRWRVSARSVPPFPARGEVSDFVIKRKTPVWEGNPCLGEVSGQAPMASARPGYSLELVSPEGLGQAILVSVVIAEHVSQESRLFFSSQTAVLSFQLVDHLLRAQRALGLDAAGAVALQTWCGN